MEESRARALLLFNFFLFYCFAKLWSHSATNCKRQQKQRNSSALLNCAAAACAAAASAAVANATVCELKRDSTRDAASAAAAAAAATHKNYTGISRFCLCRWQFVVVVVYCSFLLVMFLLLVFYEFLFRFSTKKKKC